MESSPRHRTPDQVEARFRQVLAEGDVSQPDEVEYDPAANELLFFWNEQKVCIVVELDSDGPVAVFPRTAAEPPV